MSNPDLGPDLLAWPPPSLSAPEPFKPTATGWVKAWVVEEGGREHDFSLHSSLLRYLTDPACPPLRQLRLEQRVEVSDVVAFFGQPVIDLVVLDGPALQAILAFLRR